MGIIRSTALMGALLLTQSVSWGRDLTLPVAPVWRPGTFSFDSSLTAISTNSNYTDVGSEFEKLPQNAEFQTVRWVNRLHYHWLPSLSVYAGPDAAYSMASNSLNDKSAVKLNGARLGLNHVFYRGWLRAMLALDGYMTFQSLNKLDFKNVMTQDYASFLHPKIHLFKKKKNWLLSTYLGTFLPSEGYAKLFTFAANIDYRLQSFSLGGGIFGQTVIQKDSLSDTSNQRINKTSGANLGSAYYGALNPYSYEGQIWTQFYLAKQAKLRLGLSKTLNGRNDANFMGGFIQYTYDFVSFSEKKIETEKKQNDDFEIEAPKVDQDAFDEDVRFDDSGDPLKETEKMLEKKPR